MIRTKTITKNTETKKKKISKKAIAKKGSEIIIEEKPRPEKYYEAVGRRKTSIARVRLFTKGDKIFLVNGKLVENYFPVFNHQKIVKSALEIMNCLDKFRITAIVRGGGINSQTEAIRHGIARALVLFNPDFRKRLKRMGFLKRDPRMRERKKFGLKRARRAPQWQKR